MSALFN